MRRVRFSISQSDLTVGDIAGNKKKILEGIDKACDDRSDGVLFPELALTGYPPEDLVFKPQFLNENRSALDEIVCYSKGKELLIICGFIDSVGDDIFNSAAIINNGKLIDIYHKIYLPNYGVFDEMRYFAPGRRIPVYHFHGVKVGVTICEDVWYPGGPLHYQALSGGAEVVLNVSASPFHAGKQNYRERMYSTRAGDEAVYLINCNLAGGQDELVFDGSSTAYDASGTMLLRLKSFGEDFASIDIEPDTVSRLRLKDIRRLREKEFNDYSQANNPFDIQTISIDEGINPLDSIPPAGIRMEPVLPETAQIYEALKIGTRDYVEKNGFKTVLIAISGGVDSALVAAVAVDALGPERVKGIYLPTEFSADISGEDARSLSRNLGIELAELSIQDLFVDYQKKLKPVFKDLPFNIAEENLQSRIRGNIVMALSNKFGHLVLTTGNKSEMSAGYATLYGDMAGGFAVIKDVLKTTVYELVEYRNKLKPVIPERIITRPPSAELRPDQKDSDSLPEYSVLDAIIRSYVEEDQSIEEISSGIGDENIVRRVIRMIDMSEYKRRQSPPGVKITPRAYGRDRRMPITNRFRPQ